MFTRPLLVAAILALTACSPAKTQAQPSPELSTKQKTFALIAPSGATCGASAIRQDLLLTATHCVKKGEGFKLVFSDASELVVTPEMQLEVLEDQTDHTLIKLSSKAIARHRVSKLRTAWFKETEVFHLWGGPAGIHFTFREGRVAKVDKQGVLLNCNCFFGDSGSPIFDSRGYQVGVVNAAIAQSRVFNGGANIFNLQFLIAQPFTFDLKKLEKAF